jgi:hypothetical protein
VNLGTRVGALTALLGVLLITVGVFSFGGCARPDVPCPSPTWNEVIAYLGVVALFVGIGMLVWSGWRGSRVSWVLAAVAAVPATWFIYELARQSICPMLSDPASLRACLTAYGEMTAPVLSFGVGVSALVAGSLRLLRLRSSSDIRRARSRDTNPAERDGPI